MAGVVLAKVFPSLYIRPHDRLPLEVLGTAMWIRTGAFAMLSVRRVQGVGFGFWPSLREWKIGAIFFVLMLPVVAALAWWIGWGKFHPPEAAWFKTPVIVVVYFFGGLWVLSLSEEFFFRGLLQQWMGGWLRNEWAGTDRDVDPVRRGPLALPGFPQLAIRTIGDGRRRFLRPRVPAGQQYPRFDGDACPYVHHAASFLLVGYFVIRGVVLSEKILPEIAVEVTPHGVNVAALVLGLVVPIKNNGSGPGSSADRPARSRPPTRKTGSLGIS